MAPPKPLDIQSKVDWTMSVLSIYMSAAAKEQFDFLPGFRLSGRVSRLIHLCIFQSRTLHISCMDFCNVSILKVKSVLNCREHT